MKRNVLFGFFTIFILTQIALAAWRTGEMYIQIEADSPRQIQLLLQEKFDIDNIRGNTATIYVVPDELSRIKKMGFKTEILIPDLAKHSRYILESPDFTGYHNYSQTLNLVDSLILAFPNLIFKVNYGQSIQGRQLYAVRISDNAGVDENEPEISFDGCHHGNEWTASEMVVLLMRHLLVNYGIDPNITRLVNTREIWIYPFINPDGRELNQRYNAAGVDVNRDWGYMWDAWGGSTAPFSQPESQAGRAWINANQFVIGQTNHSGTEAISYPWSYRPDQAPDRNPINFLAAGYSSTSGYANLAYFQGYNGMYAINGSAKDSFYGLMGTVGWTMEVSYTKTPPASQIPMYWNYNRPAMIYLIEQASRGVKGMVTDATNSNPVAATVWVSDASKNYWPIYTDPTVGDFHKFVLPGTYSVKIMANGYQTATVNNVVVVDTGATAVNFQLQPSFGTYAYRVIYSQIPNNNYGDEGYTPAALGAPDNINYSLGNNGYIVLDMGETVLDYPGNDLRVVEGDASPENFSVKVSNGWNGPWTSLGNGNGTTEFDLSTAGVSDFRYIYIKSIGGGSGADAGFDLDAVEGRLIPATGPFITATSYSVLDSATNNNHILEAGETADLMLDLQNLGVDPAQDVRVKISCSNPFLTVLSDSAWFGNMASGQTGSVGPYSVSVNPATPNNSKIPIQVDILAASGYQWSHPLQITILQGAKIVTNYSNIQFENTFINFTSQVPLKITNSGMDSLHIRQLITNHPSTFWVEETNLSIPPGGNQTIQVKFMPADTLTYLDTLTLMNNDPVNYVYSIPLSGRGILAPDISVAPDSIFAQLLPTDSMVVPLVISNNGAGPLTFTAQIGNYTPTDSAGGNDSFGHIWIDSDEPGGPVYSWVELSNGTGTEINIGGLNSISNSIQIGFSVPFYNGAYNSLRVCNNGWISFTTYSVSYNNTPLPSPLAPRAMIAPLWDNLYFHNDSKAYYLKESNRFIVQWENVFTATGFGPYSFELIIYDNGNLIMQYKNLTNLENAYTVGMQNSNASDGFHIVYNQPYLHDQMAILISKRSWVSIHPVGGTIAPGEQTTMDVMFKTDNFPYGDFWASVEIYSNDPDEGTVIVPLHLVVSTVHSLNTLGETLPTLFRLEQNYPNPFNPSTIIRYELPQTAAVRLDIYNVRGQKVRSLVNTHKKAGRYSVQWDARNDAGELVASGIYFYKIHAGNFQKVKRMLLLK